MAFFGSVLCRRGQESRLHLAGTQGPAGYKVQQSTVALPYYDKILWTFFESIGVADTRSSTRGQPYHPVSFWNPNIMPNQDSPPDETVYRFITEKDYKETLSRPRVQISLQIGAHAYN